MSAIKKTTYFTINLFSWIAGCLLVFLGTAIMIVLSFPFGFLIAVAGLLITPYFRRVFALQLPHLGQPGVFALSSLLVILAFAGVYRVILMEPIEQYLGGLSDISYEGTAPDFEALEQLKHGQEKSLGAH